MLSRATKDYIEAQYESGAWTPVPDYLGTFYVIPPDNSVPFAVHKSLSNPGMIAFYESIAKAEAQRETITKVGRFLTRFRPELSQDDIRKLAERYQAEQGQNVLTFATTEDEIEDIYVNGPHSCMAGNAHKFDSSIHPTRVYAAGDLAIAHIGKDSRVLCWPEKKIYGRVYGNTMSQKDILTNALDSIGYSYNTGSGFYGAKLLLVEDGDSHVMPYLDNDLEVEERGGYFIVVRDGMTADSTSGLLPNLVCSVCSDRISSDEYGDMCESCNNEHYYCISCEELTHNDNITYLEGPELALCQHCLTRDYIRCESCEEYAENDDVYEVATGTNRTENYCSGCASDLAARCGSCNEYVRHDSALLADCGESFCCTACKEEHDSSCLNCEESRDTLTAGDTSENLDMFSADEDLYQATPARELESAI